MEVESERRSPLLCADGDGNDEGVPSSHISSAPHTQQLLEQFDRSVKFADENVSSEAYHSTDVRPATSVSEVQDSSARDEGSTRHGTADGLEEGDGTRPQTDSSHSSQKKSFKPKKTFDFDNGDTALSEIDSKGNMDGHCDYKFYTGATFSGKMRHGERSGPALLVKHTGERWEINYRHNKIKGAATLLCPNGDRVSGKFVTPSWDGDIVCQFGDGSRFDGAWDYPWPLVPHTGTLVFSEGSLYTGQFIGRHPHGAGNLAMANGRRYDGEFVCSIRHGSGSYSIQPVVGTGTSIDDSSTEDNDKNGHVAHNDIPVEDSAAGIFLFNSFICGAVARALKRPEHVTVLPSAFEKFFAAFWGHQQLLVEDGVLVPGHVSKFLPFLGPASNATVHGCAGMWALTFDGGASAACAAAAAAMAKAPFCSRYIEEVRLHAQSLHASAVKEMEACTKDPHLFFPGMKDVCDNATVRLPVLPPPSILDREAFSAAVTATAAILMQGVRDCDAEGACRMGRDGGKWPWRYGGNWIQDCRHGAGAYSDASGQLFVGIWDRDVPVTGAGFMHRQPGSSAPGGIETMMCGAVHPPVPPQMLPPIPDVDRAAMATTSADAAAVLNVSPSPHLPAHPLPSPVLQSSASAAVINMLHPSHWLPSEISLLHLGSGWIGHGGSMEKLSPPIQTFSLPLRTSCARVPPACQLSAPLSWSPLEDERLAVEAARVAERKAAEDADAAKHIIDAERRAAAKKRLQLAGSKVAKGMGRDDEPENSDHTQQHPKPVDCALDDPTAASFVDQSDQGANQDFADAGGWLSVGEVGSFALEGGWYCGTVADGMRHGRGAMLCGSGSSYSGEWCNDVMHGFGQMLLASGSSLSGCWWKGRMHGLCRHISRRDGSTYEGSMVHGERRGRGKLIFAWADVYEGEMAGDLPNGNGIMHTSAGDTLRGVFKDCEPSGPGDGIKVLPDGRRFTGALLDGRPHGQGMVDKDESQVPCTFDEGVFMCYNPKD